MNKLSAGPFPSLHDYALHTTCSTKRSKRLYFLITEKVKQQPYLKKEEGNNKVQHRSKKKAQLPIKGIKYLGLH